MDLSNKKLLVIDGDAVIRKTLETRLTSLGYKVFLASNGKAALKRFSVENPDLVILDIILPQLSGYTVCRKIRETSNVPIIFVTGLSQIPQRIKGLGLGADDYLTKPFSPKELEARVFALLRRATFDTPEQFAPPQAKISIGPLVIDLTKKVIWCNNTLVPLTEVEFNLLTFLIDNAGAQVSRGAIFRNIWGYTPAREIDTRIVDVHVSRLRAKLETNPRQPKIILTVRRLGYMFPSLK